MNAIVYCAVYWVYRSMVGIEGGEEDSPCIPVVHIY